jgi:hypothetical protein
MNRKQWPLVFVVALPLSFFLFPFFCGFCNLSQANIFYLLPVWLFGSPCAGIIVATRMRNTFWAIRIASGLVVTVVIFASFFIFPPAAKTWTLGLAANFRLTKHPAQIQQWATQVLNQYEEGKLTTTTNAPYWATGKDVIRNNEIPAQIQNLWKDKPSIGIATITDNGWDISSDQTNAESLVQLTGGVPMPLKLSHCVAFSWYDTGILVGRPDFKSKWNPWYLHEITPGIYTFSGSR